MCSGFVLQDAQICSFGPVGPLCRCSLWMADRPWCNTRPLRTKHPTYSTGHKHSSLGTMPLRSITKLVIRCGRTTHVSTNSYYPDFADLRLVSVQSQISTANCDHDQNFISRPAIQQTSKLLNELVALTTDRRSRASAPRATDLSSRNGYHHLRHPCGPSRGSPTGTRPSRAGAAPSR